MKYTLYNKNIPVVDLDIDEHSLYVKIQEKFIIKNINLLELKKLIKMKYTHG